MLRRKFIKKSVSAGIVLGAPFSKFVINNRKFKISLNPGAIGVRADMSKLLGYAIDFGFESIVANSAELLKFGQVQKDDFLGLMQTNAISWGAAGLSTDFRKDHATFMDGLKLLPSHAKVLENFGITRLGTWIMPTNNDLTYSENFDQHADRLQQIANILGHHGISFGLEYVGPKTLTSKLRYPFVSSMRETKELIERIDEPNVGFVLDSFHWHCAEESSADLLSLDNNDIVTVDLNDAVSGRNIYEQLDGERELPGNSGVIDLKSFINALKTIGYDGPVRAEPFNQPLRDMEDNEALEATLNAMKRTVDL